MLRRVESGLGGHDEGVFGVYERVENASLPLRKRGRTALSICAPFSDYEGPGMKVASKMKAVRMDLIDNDMLFAESHLFYIILAAQPKK